MPKTKRRARRALLSGVGWKSFANTEGQVYRNHVWHDLCPADGLRVGDMVPISPCGDDEAYGICQLVKVLAIEYDEA